MYVNVFEIEYYDMTLTHSIIIHYLQLPIFFWVLFFSAM